MSEPVSVHILDREYLVGCEPGERESLLEAAQLVDARMREVRGNNRMAGIDRIAVLTALNLAHELLQFRRSDNGREGEIRRGLERLLQRLDDLLESRGLSA